jgi:hypothetical protein
MTDIGERRRPHATRLHSRSHPPARWCPRWWVPAGWLRGARSGAPYDHRDSRLAQPEQPLQPAPRPSWPRPRVERLNLDHLMVAAPSCAHSAGRRQPLRERRNSGAESRAAPAAGGGESLAEALYSFAQAMKRQSRQRGHGRDAERGQGARGCGNTAPWGAYLTVIADAKVRSSSIIRFRFRFNRMRNKNSKTRVSICPQRTNCPALFAASEHFRCPSHCGNRTERTQHELGGQRPAAR